MHNLIRDTDVVMALTTTAGLASLPYDDVVLVVCAGLPVLASSAQRHPDLFTNWYAQTVALLPVQIRELYRQLPEQ
ncbi:MAG: hypothetical protein KC442_19810, partial [Thermomicrobiales bacterium]|nr:hypothetical protein [Thermomicrobiales bacterium]